MHLNGEGMHAPTCQALESHFNRWDPLQINFQDKCQMKALRNTFLSTGGLAL